MGIFIFYCMLHWLRQTLLAVKIYMHGSYTKCSVYMCAYYSALWLESTFRTPSIFSMECHFGGADLNRGHQKCLQVAHRWPSVFFLLTEQVHTTSDSGILYSPDLSDGGFEDFTDVARSRFVPLAQGQCVGIQSTLDGLCLSPGQSGQQHRVVYILAVLADEVRQTSVGQPLLLLLTLWVTDIQQTYVNTQGHQQCDVAICKSVTVCFKPVVLFIIRK